MALTEPDRMTGIHLSTPEVFPYLGPGSAPLSAAEQAYLDHVARWDETERGYSAIQSTRPQTLGYGLHDSPVGLAAWLVEKWRAWSDSGGDVDGRIGRDELLTTITLYWVTGSITSSMRDYYDNRFHTVPLGRDDRVRVPTAIAVQFSSISFAYAPDGLTAAGWSAHDSSPGSGRISITRCAPPYAPARSPTGPREGPFC